MKISYKDIGFEKALLREPKKLPPAKRPNIIFKTLLKIVSLFDLLAVKGVLHPFVCAAFPPLAFLGAIIAFYKSKDL